ncbi:MAG: hypothetical protein ACTHWM_09865, partial [Yaniella sp.]|uniref:hypothetical protein n=1 Tax=Yaniella sp. TaxID=2773929 RepID=UPI003F9B5B6C
FPGPTIRKRYTTLRDATAQETPEYVIELVNDGIISIGEAENGRTNIESVNITDPVTDDLIAEIAEKAGVDSAELEGLETTGELYQKVNELRK